MRAAIDVTVHGVTPPDDEAVKAAGAQLQHEVPRLALSDLRERTEGDPGGRRESAFYGSCALRKPDQTSS